jgi:hypothetical protein
MVMAQIEPTRGQPERSSSLVLVGIVGLLVLVGGVVGVCFAWSWWVGPPRQLEVQVEPALSSDGGWRVGRTDLSQPPDPEEWVEVTPTRSRDGRLRVLVRNHRPPHYSERDFSISLAADRTPSIEVRGGAHETTSGLEWPDTNIGGLVRISSAELSPLHAEELIIEYRTVGDCSGSPVERSGKVVLTRDDLR